MKWDLNLLLLTCLCLTVTKQETKAQTLKLEARADYQRAYIAGTVLKDDCGFKGKYLNVILKGDLTEKFSYTFRHRLNKMHTHTSFFDATDFLFLDYRPTERWTLSAGKQVVGIGGYEYDRAPVNLYFCSEYWNNIPCYAWGASASFHFNKGKDQLLVQVCESPFRSFYQHADMYAYNLMWYGRHGIWQTIWSVNMQEWKAHRYISYIALGNQLQLTNQLRLQLDVMNRSGGHQGIFGKDCSVMGEVSFQPSKHVNVFAKATYDVNHSGTEADLCVKDGTEITRLGVGAEYFPLGNDAIRLHANYCYTTGKNGNPEGTLHDRQSLIDVGLTWRIDILGTLRKL